MKLSEEKQIHGVKSLVSLFIYFFLGHASYDYREISVFLSILSPGHYFPSRISTLLSFIISPSTVHSLPCSLLTTPQTRMYSQKYRRIMPTHTTLVVIGLAGDLWVETKYDCSSVECKDLQAKQGY